MEKRETTVLDYLYVIVKWRYFIILFTFIAGTITAGISLMLPEWYKATATVLISGESSGLGSSSLISQFGINAGNFLDLNTQDNRYLALLKSRNAQEHIAQKFDLKNIYKTENLEETVRVLRSNVNFGTTNEDAVYVEIEDKSPQRASDMANEYIGYLDKKNKELQTEQAHNNRVFIENRYFKNLDVLRSLEDSLHTFQEENNILSLPEQIAAQMESYSSMYEMFQLKKVQYEIGKVSSSPDNPLLKRIKTELDAYENNLRIFETNPEKFKDTEYDPGYYVPFEDIPAIFLRLGRFQREVETQKTIYAFLTQQVEFARLQEAKDTPTLQILDFAVPPERKSRPKRTLLVLAASGLTFLLTLFFAFTVEHFRRLGTISPEENEKARAIKKMLRKK